MILIGMFDSPFVRRVSIALQLYALPFEHRNWSVGRDFDAIRRFNPLGRLTHADITASCVYGFLEEALGVDPEGTRYPRLAAHARRCEAMPAFRALKAEFFAPGGTSANPANSVSG